MTSSPDPAPAPLYASDITRADVDAVDTFLATWLQGLRLAHRYDPAICQVIDGLGSVVNRLLFDLRHTFEVNDGSLDLLRTRKRHWNELCRVMAGWQKTEGYDTARWLRVDYLDGQDAAEKDAEQAAYERARLANPEEGR